MPRIPALEPEAATGETRDAYDAGVARFGRMTNMKRTLLHSLPAYRALMEWYPLFEEIERFLGRRLATVFAHALSVESDCLVCTTYMRRMLIDAGDDPGALALDERGEALVEFARAIARTGNRVPDEVYARVARGFTSAQVVALTGFAGLMIATNIINNVLEVDLDEYLYDYRAAGPAPGKD